MRYLLVSLLLLNIAGFGWSLLTQPRPQTAPEPRPLRNSGLQLVSEARAAGRERRIEETGQVCLFVSGFADIFAASEFAGATVGDGLEATVYVARQGNAAEVRLERLPEAPDDLPQWPDLAGQSPQLSAAENSCEM